MFYTEALRIMVYLKRLHIYHFLKILNLFISIRLFEKQKIPRVRSIFRSIFTTIVFFSNLLNSYVIRLYYYILKQKFKLLLRINTMVKIKIIIKY